MDLTPAADWLRDRLLNLKERNPYLGDDDTFARILHLEARRYEAGAWVWIRLEARCSYDTEAPWSDYTEYTHRTEQYGWVGPLDGAPPAPSREQLDGWALIGTVYSCEDDKCDTQHTYSHEGERVASFSTYKGVTLEIADGIARGEGGPWRFREEKRGLRREGA